VEETVNGSYIVKPNRQPAAVWLILACFTLLYAASAFAQNGSMSPNQGENDGVSVGGKWMKFESEDKMTGAHKVRFELLADGYLKEDPDYKPRVELYCSNGKYEHANFNPGTRLAPPNRPGFYGQPQMEVMVRVNDKHSYHGWNWLRDRALSMDKGTTRELIGADVFKIEFGARGGREIAEFSPSGLDLNAVRQVCDLKPKKPSNND
jgi:hypothetical protein